MMLTRRRSPAGPQASKRQAGLPTSLWKRQTPKRRQAPIFRCNGPRGADEMGSWVEKIGGGRAVQRDDEAAARDDEAAPQDDEPAPPDHRGIPRADQPAPAGHHPAPADHPPVPPDD